MGEVIIAVDGGGSKTDVVALSHDGALVGRATGSGSSPHFIGLDASVRLIDGLVRDAAGGCEVGSANVYLSGLDFEREVSAFETAIADLPWAGPNTTVDNDLYALLRSGTSERDAVAVICGTGINALGRRADGEVARFAAVGVISGDWGGGTGLGEAALWHAARHVDGRGAATSLTEAIPGVLGVASVPDLIASIHFGEISSSALAALSPVIFDHAARGDAVAGELVDRQGLEIALMAAACIERLSLGEQELPVVVGGGIVAARHPRLMATIERELGGRAPRATITHIAAAPIVGAALLALESAGAPDAALDRARRELEA